MKRYRKPSSISYFGATGIVPLVAIAGGEALAAAVGGLVAAAAGGAATGALVAAAKSMGDDIVDFPRQPAVVAIS